MPRSLSFAVRAGTFVILCVAVLAAQNFYDLSRVQYVLPDQIPSATLIKSFDLGLDSAVASFLWLGTRTELPFLSQGPEHFLAGLDLVNQLDPRLSTPYAFTILVLPSASKYSSRIQTALAVGERGLASADPNWQIPFYMGAIYQLELNDNGNAARYFDLAAATPGIPETVRRFAINYGIDPNSLQSTKAAWVLIYETSPDPVVRDRAAAHVAHIEILQYLNAAVQAFQAKYLRYPKELEELVGKGFISSIPADPFGFTFKIYSGGVVGIAP